MRGIVSRWARRVENRSARYIAFVCDRLGVDPDAPVDLDRPDVLRTLVRAIIRKECGPGPLAEGDWYDQTVLDEGIRRAG